MTYLLLFVKGIKKGKREKKEGRGGVALINTIRRGEKRGKGKFLTSS